MASHDHAHHQHHHGASPAHGASAGKAPGMSLFAMSAAQRLVGVVVVLALLWAALWVVIR